MEDLFRNDLHGGGITVLTVTETNTFTVHTILLVRKREKSKGGGLEQIGRIGEHIERGRATTDADILETEEVIGSCGAVLPGPTKEEEGEPHYAGCCFGSKRPQSVRNTLSFKEDLDGDGFHSRRRVIIFPLSRQS